MASSDFSTVIRSRISADRALYRPLRWPSEPPIVRDLDRSLTSPSLRAIAVYAGDDSRGSYSISATVAAFAGNEAARPSLSRAAQLIGPVSLRRHFAFPFGTARRFAFHPSLGRGQFVGSLQERRSPHASDPRLTSFELLLVEELCTSLMK